MRKRTVAIFLFLLILLFTAEFVLHAVTRKRSEGAIQDKTTQIDSLDRKKECSFVNFHIFKSPTIPVFIIFLSILLISIYFLGKNEVLKVRIAEKNQALISASLLDNQRDLLSYVKEPILAVSPDMKMMWVNQAAISTFRINNLELSNTKWNEIIAYNNKKINDCPVKKAIATGELVVQNKVPLIDDHLFTVAACPQYIDGKLKMILLSISDVTKEENNKLKEIQTQKLEILGSLATGISHDFNNILQSILGNSDMLFQSITGAEDREILQDIITAGERGKKLISQLMMFSRKDKYQPLKQELNQIVKKSVQLTRSILGENFKLEFRPHSEELLVVVDKVQIDRIINNLCVNARDALIECGKLDGDGVISVSIGKINKLQDNKEKFFGNIAISDNGPGISDEIKNKIFDPFFTTKAPGKGTGMGLASVCEIVKQSNGLVELETSKEKGTTFNIMFPLAGMGEGVKILRDEGKQQQQSLKDYNNMFSGINILLAEDEKSIRKLTIRLLKKMGCNVESAENGKEALNIFKTSKTSFDILILDMIMPEMGGRKAYEEIAKISPNIKVIFCSGYSRSELDADFLAQIKAEVLAKPYKVHELGNHIENLLNA